MFLLTWIAIVLLFAESIQETEEPYTLYEIYILETPPKRYPNGDSEISNKEVNDCFKEYRNAVEERYQYERKLADEGKTIKPSDKKTDLNLIRRRRSDPYVHMLESTQLPFALTTDKLTERHNLSQRDVSEKLPQQPLVGSYCNEAVNNCTEPQFTGRCNANSRYRTADGTCNNLQNPTWGSAGVCFRRLLNPNYIGNSGFRQSVLGGPLPRPRDLSLNIHNNLNRPTNYVNHMYMFFGQLLDHDLTQAPISTTVDNEAIECCPPSQNSHPQCAPIIIRSNDPFYSQFGTTCMNFVRSAVCPTCRLGPRQQMNQITAFIDASFVYGNSLNETNTLRAFDGSGRLRVQSSSNGDLLPRSPDPRNDQCSFPDSNEICFQAGDARANQHPSLTSLHTLFLREHNRLANGLRRVNPQWNDERIFQETRKIVGALMQVITYKEYLPITLGQERMTFFNLWMLDYGYTKYNSNTDPSLYNEFSGATFRFGHSLINSITAQSYLNGTNQPRLLRDTFFQPFELYTGLIDPLMNSVTRSASQWFDRHVVPDVTNYLYRVRGDPAGLDLASINIQRGRDHGLPTYTQMVNFCSDNVYNIRKFKDLVDKNIMSYKNVQLLQNNYRSVNDIDLWTGILSETPNENAVIGPTATCVVGLQFNRLKFGDRFYFEHGNEEPSFSYSQIQELRKMTLSKIMCLNTNIRQLPLNAMLFITRNNPAISCSRVQGVDLSYWKE
ncbi:chorion peroxidase [Trichonephila clavata]|uniref:Chorion peroxidase n=1 Tax=Trichonephila clavata TaxID=2740835 RepID=A0A8X6JHM7_TRICU|nr:chorion peroxidase [Trichonephila clavata]